MQFDGAISFAARPRIIDWLEAKGFANNKINYKQMNFPSQKHVYLFKGNSYFFETIKDAKLTLIRFNQN